MAAADVRGTGVDDVLVPADVQNDATGTGGFEGLHNDGAGALDPPSFFTYPGSENPRALVVGDFNNDGKLDVAMADFTSSITVLFQGNGDGTFTYDDTLADPLHLQGSDNALTAADLNGDCKLDLAAGTFDGGLVVMRNDTPQRVRRARLPRRRRPAHRRRRRRRSRHPWSWCRRRHRQSRRPRRPRSGRTSRNGSALPVCRVVALHRRCGCGSGLSSRLARSPADGSLTALWR